MSGIMKLLISQNVSPRTTTAAIRRELSQFADQPVKKRTWAAQAPSAGTGDAAIAPTLQHARSRDSTLKPPLEQPSRISRSSQRLQAMEARCPRPSPEPLDLTNRRVTQLRVHRCRARAARWRRPNPHPPTPHSSPVHANT